MESKILISFKEEELMFQERESPLEKGLLEKGLFNTEFSGAPANPDPEILGIKIRIGNEPIVRNLKKLIELSHGQLPPEMEVLFEQKDIYTVTHAIGAIRLKGHAKVDELQYNAEIVNLPGTQTIDLLPNTSFKTVWEVNSNFEGAVKASGNFSAKFPDELKQALTNKFISLGGDIDLQLSSSTQFVGKLSCSVKFPVVQSMGMATNKCTWVLNPNDSPLLGDQLLVQTVAVPKGTETLIFNIKGLAKADKGIFWKKEEIETSTINIHVNLK